MPTNTKQSMPVPAQAEAQRITKLSNARFFGEWE